MLLLITYPEPFSMSQSVAHLTAELGVGSGIQLRRKTFMEIDGEIISVVILPILLNQERHLSVTGESIA